MLMTQNKNNVTFEIVIEDERWKGLFSAYNTVLNTITTHHDIPKTELSIMLSNNNHIQKLNKEYRGKDRPTNVLSFPSDEEDYLGDLIFAYETVDEESIEQSKPFDAHFTHLLVHGVLHLLGYDHMNDQEAEEMEALEIQILADLNIKNPYEIAKN